MNLKELNKFKYVSFDIFDTLIKRNVHNPKDVFKLVELKYNHMFANQKITDFYHNRIDAEIKANAEKDTEDITFDDIYLQLEGIYDKKTLNLLKEIEIQVEMDICVVNQDMLPVYQHCVKSGKEILIISDMYLPQNIITEILNKNGISHYKKLYVSSTFGLKKRTGSLFRHVLRDLKINKKQMTHIGDNKISDFLQPLKVGIKPILIPTHVNHLHYYNENELPKEDVFAYRTICSFINNHIGGDRYFQVGYETVGPLLFGYINWLINELKEKNIKKIFFLSRDGYLVKKAFDILNTTDIQSQYFFASRRSWIVPSLWMKPELQDVIRHFSTAKRISAKSFLERVGLDPIVYQDTLAEYNLDLNTDVIKYGEVINDSFTAFYQFIQSHIINKSKMEFHSLISYIEQESFHGDIAIFDIGWKGSIQNAMLNIIERQEFNTNIFGYYLGLRRVRSNAHMKGYLFEPGYNEMLKYKEYLCNPFFETFFSAGHGSVERYTKENDKIVPVLLPHEFSAKRGDHIDELKFIDEVQKGALQFVKDIHLHETFNYLVLSPYSSVQNIMNLGIYPSNDDVKLFGDFRYSDFHSFNFSKTKSIFYYLFKPKSIFRDFSNSVWSIGFFKRLFKIPFPYYKFYKKVHFNIWKENN